MTKIVGAQGCREQMPFTLATESFLSENEELQRCRKKWVSSLLDPAKPMELTATNEILKQS